MNTALRCCLAAALAVSIAGCSSGSTAIPRKTALEIREMQTRTFETADLKMVMKSVLNVLQDEGYIVKNANMDLGLITADKQVETSSQSNVSSGSATTALVLGLAEVALRVAFSTPDSSPGSAASSSSSGDDERWEKYRSMECSANISEFGAQTRVRINIQVRAVDNKGDMVTVYQIEDPLFYQDFFAKVDKGIFIAKEKL